MGKISLGYSFVNKIIIFLTHLAIYPKFRGGLLKLMEVAGNTGRRRYVRYEIKP